MMLFFFFFFADNNRNAWKLYFEKIKHDFFRLSAFESTE